MSYVKSIKVKSITLISLGVIFILSIALIVPINNKREKDVNQLVDSMVLPEPSRRDIGNLSQIAPPSPKLSSDADDLIDISRQLEFCIARLDEEKGIIRRFTNRIIESLYDLPRDERGESMLFLYSEGIFDLQTLTAINERIIFEEWRSLVPLIEPYESVDGIRYERISTAFTKLSTAIRSGNLRRVENWFSEYEELADVRFEISSRELRPSIYVSVDSVIARNFEHLPNDLKDFLLEKITFSPESLHYAVMAGVSDQTFRTLYNQLEDIEHSNEFLFAVDNRVTNLLGTVLMHGSINQLQYILSVADSMVENDPFVTPPVNRYLERLRHRSALNEEDEEKMRLLSQSVYRPNLVFNEKTNWHEFQGIKDRPLSSYDIDWFETFEISSNQNPLADVSFNQSLVNNDISRMVNAYKIQIENVRFQESECDQIAESRMDIYPSFHKVTDFLGGLNNQYHPRDVFNLLTNQSPILVERYLHQLIYSSSSYSGPTEVLSEVMNVGSEQLEQLKNELLLHEQNYVIAHVCTHGTTSDVVYLVESGWYVDISAPYFQQCRDENELFSLALWEASQSEEAVPSPTYQLVKMHSYDEAYSAVVAGRNTHGITGGRDAFGLFLDRILPLSVGILNEVQKNLLFAFLDSTSELEDYHYRRLNRLKLKEPTLLDEIEEAYPHFHIDNNLGLSRYYSKT